MSIIKEAGKLYLYSKELHAINKKIKKLSSKAEKHRDKHERASSERKKRKHYNKHSKATEELQSLVKKHNAVIKRILHHHSTFSNDLKKENKL